jgi:hypothetical protein
MPPRTKWTSLPQTPQETTRTMASFGPASGAATSSME